MNTYFASRGAEIAYLRAFLQSDFEASVPSSATQYLSAPASDMLTTALSEFKDELPVLYFYLDKPGVYQRLDDGEKSELISRISRDGEISAFKWAYNIRPDIFHSADFVPQGVPREQWIEFTQQWAVANQSNK